MSNFTSRFRPVWHYPKQARTREITAELKSWLIGTDSLTRRLVDACGQQFNVKVRNQRWQRPQLGEAQLLGIAPEQNCFVREVHLCCGDVPWIFAHTVIPHRAARGVLRPLTHLGARPLGAVLFSDPSVVRKPLQIARIEPGCDLFERAQTPVSFEKVPIWGRRSVFYLYNQPLLVSEIFLPTLGQFQKN